MTPCALPFVAKPFRNLPISEIIHFAPLATPLFSLKRHSHWGSTLKEHILSFKNEPSFGRDKLCREANKEPQKSFFMVEMEKKEHDDIHYTFTRLTKLKRRELVPF